ncbi:MAG: MgtC/SapB family protein [Chitinophagaceae bacterium]|nr:MgtC/SapB family protein [Chitinophagaceae bacterium]
MPYAEFTYRVLIALLCGFAIGLERQLNHKNAGIRTHSLVALGSAIFVLLSYQIVEKSGGDITRIVGQIVTGVGFICAGVIIHQGTNIQGLTTSVTIWCTAAIGCVAGAGAFPEAFIATGLVIFINAVLLQLDNWIEKK